MILQFYSMRKFVFFLLSLYLSLAASAPTTPHTLNNGLIMAKIDGVPYNGLVSLTDASPESPRSIDLLQESWSVSIIPSWTRTVTPGGTSLTLASDICQPRAGETDPKGVIYSQVWDCPGEVYPGGGRKPPGSMTPEMPVDYTVTVIYELRSHSNPPLSLSLLS